MIHENKCTPIVLEPTAVSVYILNYGDLENHFMWTLVLQC